MKKSCLYFDKKIQMCILHIPLQRSYLKVFSKPLTINYQLFYLSKSRFPPNCGEWRCGNTGLTALTQYKY